jgi:hypothetical protein
MKTDIWSYLLVALFGFLLAIVSRMAYVYAGLAFSFFATGVVLLALVLVCADAHPEGKR